MGTENTPIPSGAEGLKELVALAGQARGIDIVPISAPDGAEGLPATIPVGLRHGTTPELVDLSKLFEPWREHPRRKTGTATAQTLESFIALVNRHKTDDSAIFADTSWEKPSFQAVIDYHEQNGITVDGAAAQPPENYVGTPGHLRHRIAYAFPLSEEWQAWVKMDGEPMSQADFAAFIEEHIRELASPLDTEKVEIERDFMTAVATPADMMKLSRGLQVNVNSVAKAAVTLQTGEGQIAWSEEHNDADGKPLKVPGVFILNIAPFFMGDKARIPVRLRYRLNGGKVVWSFSIYRPDIHVTERVREDLDRVGRDTGLPTFEGAPES